jgi:hypothetical protein
MTAAVNEVQLVTVTADGGTWSAAFNGSAATAALAENITAANLQTALRALSTINGANVTVTGSAGGPYTVTFIGALAATNVPKLTVTDIDLTGTSHGVTVAQVTPGSALSANELGVPMFAGASTEPVGPEDALGPGTKRGDYSGRMDGSAHYSGGVLQTTTPWGEHADQPDKKGGVSTV